MVKGLHSGRMIENAQTKALTIGEVARKAGLPIRRVRYYEERGLLEPFGRTEAGYRLYTEEEVARLKFVKRAKLLGLKLKEIRELVSLAAGCNGGEIVPRLEDVIEEKLSETDRKMRELAAFRGNLLYYRRRLLQRDPAQSCGCGEQASFCGCLEAATGGETTIGVEGFEEVSMEKLEIREENGRIVTAREENGCEECGCECCDTQGCECCQ
jgi:DNA-binding transcriptional MerR regulator